MYSVCFIDCVISTDEEMSVPNVMCYPMSVTDSCKPYKRLKLPGGRDKVLSLFVSSSPAQTHCRARVVQRLLKDERK